MDKIFAIRAGIFFAAGVIVLLFPKQVFRFQASIFKKFHLKYKTEDAFKTLYYSGIAFMVIAAALLVYSIVG